jgi:hypothetical protein
VKASPGGTPGGATGTVALPETDLLIPVWDKFPRPLKNLAVMYPVHRAAAFVNVVLAIFGHWHKVSGSLWIL